MGEHNVQETAVPHGEKTMHDKGCDDAAEMFNGDLVVEYSAREESIVRWKLDLSLVPMMLISYLLSFVDKGILSTAAVYGLRDDLRLVGQQYSWSNSIFYFGFLVWQYPNSIFMQRLPIGRWIGGMVFLWGVCVAATAGVTNFATLAVARFFLGLFEASNNPVFTLLVSQYYTRQEHALRACLWWAGGPIAAFIGDGVSNGIGHFNGALSRWQYLQIAVVRVLQNHTGLKNKQYKKYQVIECFRDPQVLMLFAIVFLQCIPGGGLTAFNKIILTGLGYSSVESTVVAMPEHAIQLVSVLLAGGVCSYIGKGRCIAMILSNICVLVGSVLLYTLPAERKMSRLGAVYSLLTCTVSYIMCMSMISSNIAGFTKKMTASVMIFVGYCVGQIITPQFFITAEAPTYPTGFRAYFVTASMMIVIQAALMMYLINENRRRDKRSEAPVIADQGNQHHILETDLMDLTDREQPNFRYTW
ncbi:Major facilitator superfamily domain general substrate transporter [Penicillium samsonianum]|uniref:Major facilitator superfamily domain general substrate transporter n=1 Tax=Penicillium samsonianum TaxID=1882272 RepID=UPI0025483BDF|nr:Major facilitator superfamily domain general substrate transporter [Penicillium samsonianum]KAJ6124554.1 Major facilitator superfamily domain general substrate transporter [Penicillium samsonianum]